MSTKWIKFLLFLSFFFLVFFQLQQLIIKSKSSYNILTVTIHHWKKFVSQAHHMVRVYIFQIWTLLVKISLGSIRFEHSLAYYTTPSVIVSPTKPSQKIKFLFLLDPPGTFTTICKRKYIYLLMNKLIVEITQPNQTTIWNSLFVKTIGIQKLSPDSKGQPRIRHSMREAKVNQFN